jgi:cell division protease FtsH
VNRTVPIASLPTSLRIEDAVEAACGQDITWIEERLRRGTSVLVECDKDLSLFLYLAVRARLRRTKDAPRLVLVDGRPAPDAPPRGNLPRMLEQLTDAIRGAVDRTVIVLLHLDVLTTTHTGLTLEAREAIPLLYENPEAVLLGFRDPSFEVPKVIREVFAARREITGLARESLPKLVTQREARSLHPTDFDPFGLYKYVSGLNPVRARRLFADLALRREAAPGRDHTQEVYQEIRRQTATDDIELPNVDLDADLGGYHEVKSRLREELIDLVRRKEALTGEGDIVALEALLPRGVIFHGPPGTGKTYFAKAVATALNATVIIVSGPELKSKWVGESEENLRRVFRQARQAAPSVVVFDEIDAFAHQRGTYQGSGVEHSMVNQLLTEMDGFRKNEMVFVVGTTNYLESLDGALMRPGRFEFLIEIPAPDPADRKAILEIYDKKFALGLTPALIEHLVRRTEGMADRDKGIPFSGDHLHAVCRALKRQQLREGSAVPFTPDDLDRALQRKSRRPIVLSREEEKVIAVHEAGHALVAMLLPKATPPERICIAQDQEGALGYVLRAARARPYVTTEDELRADICVGLGGQVAERLCFGEASVGAYQDLQRANAIARAMVEQYGMSEPMGPRVVIEDELRRDGAVALSPQRRDRMDTAVEQLLRTELARCEALLRENSALHDALWRLLLEKKVLEGPALRDFPRGGAKE